MSHLAGKFHFVNRGCSDLFNGEDYPVEMLEKSLFLDAIAENDGNL
jgi:hypothetical protein